MIAKNKTISKEELTNKIKETLLNNTTSAIDIFNKISGSEHAFVVDEQIFLVSKDEMYRKLAEMDAEIKEVEGGFKYILNGEESDLNYEFDDEAEVACFQEALARPLIEIDVGIVEKQLRELGSDKIADVDFVSEALKGGMVHKSIAQLIFEG